MSKNRDLEENYLKKTEDVFKKCEKMVVDMTSVAEEDVNEHKRKADTGLSESENKIAKVTNQKVHMRQLVEAMKNMAAVCGRELEEITPTTILLTGIWSRVQGLNGSGVESCVGYIIGERLEDRFEDTL